MTPRKRLRSPNSSPEFTKVDFTRPRDPVYYSYQIGRGEQLVLTFEPYKSYLLPFWRFKTVPIATKSSQELWDKFTEFGSRGDFVGQDMTRKFIQMGMTRAGRYANRAGGKKYSRDGELLPKTTNHKGAQEKAQASAIFRAKWEECKKDDKYLELRSAWERDKKKWVEEHPDEVIDLEMTRKEGKKGRAKKEQVKEEEEEEGAAVEEEEDEKPKRRKRS